MLREKTYCRMFSDADIYVTFIATVTVLGTLLIICVILMVLQHHRFKRFKQQTGQLFAKERVDDKNQSVKDLKCWSKSECLVHLHLFYFIGHSVCWPDGLRTLAGLGSNPGLEGREFFTFSARLD